jgi:transcriptional regulator with XRE-family HTH domain
MNGDFPRILALLRKEKGISQKQASKDLGISQALLSHYEKGIRECGLAFLVRCADYYDVPCDYLLGRSADRSGATLTVEDIPDPELAAGKENVWNGGILPVLNKKLIFNSLNILFDLLAKGRNKALITEVSSFLMLAVYLMFRLIYESDPKNQQGLFALPPALSRGYVDAEMQLCEANAEAIVQGKGGLVPSLESPGEAVRLPLDTQTLSDHYPMYASSLLNLIRNAENRVLVSQKRH